MPSVRVARGEVGGGGAVLSVPAARGFQVSQPNWFRADFRRRRSASRLHPNLMFLISKIGVRMPRAEGCYRMNETSHYRPQNEIQTSDPNLQGPARSGPCLSVLPDLFFSKLWFSCLSRTVPSVFHKPHFLTL